MKDELDSLQELAVLFGYRLERSIPIAGVEMVQLIRPDYSVAFTGTRPFPQRVDADMEFKSA